MLEERLFDRLMDEEIFGFADIHWSHSTPSSARLEMKVLGERAVIRWRDTI